jgi:hypothetical protein
LLALTITRNRIVLSPIKLEFKAEFPDGLDRANQTSTLASNDGK